MTAARRLVPVGSVGSPAVQRPQLGLDRDGSGRAGSNDQAFSVLEEVVEILGDVSYGVIGGVASAAYGRPRWTKDIDVFCRAEDADRVLDRFARRGFDVDRTNPMWIYKAFRDDVQIDVIFKVRGRSTSTTRWRSGSGRSSWTASRSRFSPGGHRGDEGDGRRRGIAVALVRRLGILAAVDLDWEYLLMRARKSPNRASACCTMRRRTTCQFPGSAALHESVAAPWE